MAKSCAPLAYLVLALAFRVTAVEPPMTGRDDPNPAGRAMDFQVIERETKQPVAGMTITTQSYRKGRKSFRGTTDRRGHCIVPVPPNAIRSGFFEVLASKDGLVPIRVYWCDVAKTTGIPDACTLTADRVTVEMPGFAPGVKQVRFGPPDPEDEQAIADEPPAAGHAAPGTQAHVWPPRADVIQLTKEGPLRTAASGQAGTGRTIRGRVIDTAGKPVAGASVIPEIRDSLDRFGWRATTGADGRFQWTNAPLEAMDLHVYKSPEGRAAHQEIGPNDRDVVVTLPAPINVRVRGKVVDAETGHSINRFRVITGGVWPDDFMRPAGEQGLPTWNRDAATTRVDGRYEARFRTAPIEPADDYFFLVRVEAEGYATSVSRKFRVDESEVTYDFSLRPRAWIKGTVHSPAGTRVAGAVVSLTLKSQPTPTIDRGQVLTDGDIDQETTGPDGRFALPMPDERGRIFAVSKSGIAMRSVEELAANPVMRLEPWGRIEGQLNIGAKPGVSEDVSFTLVSPQVAGETWLSLDCWRQTDLTGHFVLDRVVPGRVSVYRSYRLADGSLTHSQRREVNVVSGQTATVTIGGSGRPVVGRVTAAGNRRPIDYTKLVGQLWLLPREPQLPIHFDIWDPERRSRWWTEFIATDEGKVFRQQTDLHGIDVEIDGTFRVEDVPPGRYWLNLEYGVRPADSVVAGGSKTGDSLVAGHQTLVQVPPSLDRKPLDLGDAVLKRAKLAGAPAP